MRRPQIHYRGTIKQFLREVRPEICRCGMLGLRIATDWTRIQRRINRAAAIRCVAAGYASGGAR